jgi:hypothetical protein
MSCSDDIIYQDKNICILNPELKKGVLLIHTIGYMVPITGKLKELSTLVERNGLKSSGQLLKNRGVNVPGTLNEVHAHENIEVSSRGAYMKYNEEHFNRIFFRPPSTAPYTLKDDTIVSAGNWRDFIGGGREDRLFFGGESYSKMMDRVADYTSVHAQGIACIRVDPDKTYVFYEKVKDTLERNKNTQMEVPKSEKTLEKSRARFQASRILLSTFLDMLQGNPGQIEDGYEVMATTSNIPACAFEKLIHYGDTSYDGKEMPEDDLIKKAHIDKTKKAKAKALEMQKEVGKLTKDLQDIIGDMSEAAYQVNRLIPDEYREKKVLPDPIPTKLETNVTKLSEILKKLIKKMPESVAEMKRVKLHPYQKLVINSRLQEFKESALHAEKTVRLAKGMLSKKNSQGGGGAKRSLATRRKRRRV